MSMGKCNQYPEPARTMRKDKFNYFVDYIFDIGMHLPGRRDVYSIILRLAQLQIAAENGHFEICMVMFRIL